jgi:glycosyltransferase involved in cell wall biosynthesis
MEAIAAGCYCLSHWWDGADELLPEANLFHTDAELIEKLACYAGAAPADRQASQAALRQRVAERFDVDRIKVQIRQVVEAAAGG